MARAPKRDDVAVKIDARLYRKAKMIAAYHGVTLAEYLSDRLSKPVDKDYRAMQADMGEEKDGGPKP
jgi:hypothetical protein